MIIDISQEITKCNVYPGDPKPKVNKICNIVDGDTYNLSEISMCAHNGTHIDSPNHFIKDGKTIDELSLDHYIGKCIVIECNVSITDKVIQDLYDKIKNYQRIIFKGIGVMDVTGAREISKLKLLLLGTSSQSFGPIESPAEVHKILLEKEIVLLEGLVLDNVSEDEYFLCAQPLNFKGIEGSPCRAVLIK